jgi:hypothetical protein
VSTSSWRSHAQLIGAIHVGAACILLNRNELAFNTANTREFPGQGVRAIGNSPVQSSSHMPPDGSLDSR